MKTLEQVLETVRAPIDRPTVEDYIAREWLRPISGEIGWYFEEIDIARIELVYQLTHEINVNADGMDIVLSLLDQLYGARKQMQSLAHAITQQPPAVRAAIMTSVTHAAAGESS